MKVRTNKIFDERFGKAFQKSETETLPSALLSIVDSGFVSEDGAWFIASLWNGGSKASGASFSTKTEVECFVNHLHLDDFCEQNFLGSALRCDAVLRKQLTSQ